MIMEEPPNSENKSRSVLIADDTESIQDSLEFVVENSGCKAWTAGDGEEAVKKYKEHHPKLVFMDIKMPKKNGIDAIKEIKAFDKNANIIIITAFSGDKQLRELVKTDSIKVIDKPFEIAEIRKWL